MIQRESFMQFGRMSVSRQGRMLAAVLLFGTFGIVDGARAQAFSSTVIPSPDPRNAGFFGGAVSLSGDGQTALVGSLEQGRAYIFSRNSGGGWDLETRLPAAGPSAQGFGRAVALSADGMVALVANPVEAACPSGGFNDCGAVYFYVRTGGAWAQKMRLLVPTDFDFESGFGTALALSADGSTVLVSLPGDDCFFQPCRGVVFAYERTGDVWTLADTLRASNPHVEVFGADVSLSPDGSTALIGAPLTDCAAGPDCGEAYVFSRGGGHWSEQVKLTGSDPLPSRTFFGTAVDLAAADGRTALVGAPRIDLSPGTGPGSVYTFAESGGSWIETQKITGGSSGDGFGRFLDLAADGRSALVGAVATNCSAGVHCGAVYRLVRMGGIWASPQPLTSFPAGALGGFTVELAGDGTVGLAGAPGTSCAAGASCGSIYIFEGLSGILEVPTLSEAALALLALLLAAGGWVTLRRRPRPAR